MVTEPEKVVVIPEWLAKDILRFCEANAAFPPRETLIPIGAINAFCERMERAVSEPVADHIGGEGESGISWNGYYLRGDNKSVDFIAATLRKVEYLEQCVDQLRARLATPPVREAVTTIIARCEALEDEASDRLAVEDCGDIERGYFNGQKATAKSLRLHLHDMTRAALPTPSEVGEPVAAESGGEGEREYEAFRAECHCAGDFPPATHVLTMHGFHLALVRYLAGRTTPPNTNGDAVREELKDGMPAFRNGEYIGDVRIVYQHTDEQNPPENWTHLLAALSEKVRNGELKAYKGPPAVFPKPKPWWHRLLFWR